MSGEPQIPKSKPSGLAQAVVNEATSLSDESQMRQVMAVQQKV